MQTTNRNQKGFTLLEVIITLILVGVTAVLAGMWIVSVASGYILARENAENVQKGQLALTRLAKEFAAIQSIQAANGTSITFTRADISNPSGVSITVSQSENGDQLLLNGNLLTDNVSAFTLAYCDAPDSVSCPSSWSQTSRIIEITLTLSGAENIPFTHRVVPRNL